MDIILNKVSNEILNDISLEIAKNQKIAIVGENGVGKTTFLRTLVGLSPFSGEMMIFGKNMQEQKDFKELYKDIGYLFQDSDDSFIAPSVLEEVAFNLYNKTDDMQSALQEAQKLLQEFGIEELAQKVPVQLSGGQKRIVALCAVFIHSPKLLLLDEPNNHLDDKFSLKIKQKLKEYEGSIIMVVHNTEFAKGIVDRFYHLDKEGLKEIDV